MELEIGKGKKGRRAYGFDDIAIVPSRRTRDPDDIDVTWMLGPYRFELPLLASAMDGVVSPKRAGVCRPPAAGFGDGRRRLSEERRDHWQARRARGPQLRRSLDSL